LTDKVIFWFSADLVQFCLAYYFQKSYKGELFSIIDITNKPKGFFKEQNLVKFSKSWFFHDHIKVKKNPDLKKINENNAGDEGFVKSLKEDQKYLNNEKS